jgi:hypothetical protein
MSERLFHCQIAKVFFSTERIIFVTRIILWVRAKMHNRDVVMGGVTGTKEYSLFD